VYRGGLGGLGDEAAEDLSPHLAGRRGARHRTPRRSRHRFGERVVRNVAEPRRSAAGDGHTALGPDARSADRDWRRARVYLTGVLLDPRAAGRVFEIGGTTVVTYADLMRMYAQVTGLRRRLVVRVPVLSPRLSSWWIRLVTPLPVEMARALVDSLVNEVVVRDPTIREIVPITPSSTREALEFAVRRVANLDVETTWASAELVHRHPRPPPTCSRSCAASAGSAGGTSPSRCGRCAAGSTCSSAASACAAVAVTPTRCASATRSTSGASKHSSPAAAWLEWRVTTEPDGRTRLDQRARFRPRGLLGRAYWYTVLPFHAFVFAPLVRRLAVEAERRATSALDIPPTKPPTETHR